MVRPMYDLKTDVDLSKFLLDTIRRVCKNELDLEKAVVISKLADKYTKNEVMRCIKAKVLKSPDGLDGEEANELLMPPVSEGDK